MGGTLWRLWIPGLAQAAACFVCSPDDRIQVRDVEKMKQANGAEFDDHVMVRHFATLLADGPQHPEQLVFAFHLDNAARAHERTRFLDVVRDGEEKAI